jgi:hypothetical protein
VWIGPVGLQEHAQPPGAIHHGNRHAVAVLLALIKGGNRNRQPHADAHVAMGDDLRVRGRRHGTYGDGGGSKHEPNGHERTSP